ncbi:2-oxo-4-hydroxy-4-carboxy-5-ureidoimidazoline decarboxylase, partial [Planktothrix agardhii]|uniref:2-oxo-4-hydroxy-4-carboxy-5-ureidoimidazoline decarboxylase n=1 Tax=Planktothrix agardhii TaxID=1160 RepID=UPI0029E55A3D
QTYSLSQVNQMTKAEFIAVLGTIFEASPWVAEQAELKRPFGTIEILYQTMVAIVKFEQRLNHSKEQEKITALEEIYKIAKFRLYEKTVR